jgi:excisionase family DNA binding protein
MRRELDIEPASRPVSGRSPGPEARRARDQCRLGDGCLLDYVAAAHYLCTTPRHVGELWAKRCLTAVKVGRHVRFAREDLDAFITTSRVEALR